MKSYLQKSLCGFSFGWLLLSSLPVAAYMPFTTDDAGTNAKGGFQVEQYFYTLLLVGQGSTDTGSVSSGEDYQGVDNARAFPFTFSRGLTERMDLQFAPTYYLQPLGSFSRVANYTVNLKWRFLGDGETGLNLALRPQLIAPAGIIACPGNGQPDTALTLNERGAAIERRPVRQRARRGFPHPRRRHGVVVGDVGAGMAAQARDHRAIRFHDRFT